MTDILQAVRPHWKVDLAIDVAIYIDQALCEVFAVGLVPFCECRYRAWLVTAIMINRSLVVLRDLLHKLLPYMTLVVNSIRPKRIMRPRVCLTHQQANQIIESPVRE